MQSQFHHGRGGNEVWAWLVSIWRVGEGGQTQLLATCSQHAWTGKWGLLATYDGHVFLGSCLQTDPLWALLDNKPLLLIFGTVSKREEPPTSLWVQDAPIPVCKEGQASWLQVQVEGCLC